MTDQSPQNLPAVPPRPKPQITAGAPIRALVPTTLEEAYRLGAALHQSGVVPYQLKSPEAVCAVIMRGMELGLPPMEALGSLMVVNNRVSMFGDAAIARVRGSGLLAYLRETIEGDGDDMAAVCEVGRRNPDGSVESITERFSVGDAKLAGLWTKRGRSGEPTPWQTYPKRMLRFRARGFALRDLFADVLGGMRTVEEEQDIERMEQTALVAPPPPPADEPQQEQATLVAPPPPPDEDEALAEDASFLALVAQGTAEEPDKVGEYDVALSACKTGDEFDTVVEEWSPAINEMPQKDRLRALVVFEKHMERLK